MSSRVSRLYAEQRDMLKTTDLLDAMAITEVLSRRLTLHGS